MKISVDDVEVFSLSETQKLVIQNDIPDSTLEDPKFFENDIKRRLEWVILDQKYKKCFNRLKLEWDKKLVERGVLMIPADQDEYAALVFSQPDYKSRSVKLAEETAALSEKEASRNAFISSEKQPISDVL